MVFPNETQVILALRSGHPFLVNRFGYGAFVGMRYPYLYMETPKAACTTTKAHLWHLEGFGPLPVLSDVHKRPVGDERHSLLTLDETDAVSVACGPDTFRFCVWRDPVRRLASTYMAKIRLGRDASPEWNYYRRHLAEEAGMRSAKDVPFDVFVRYVCGMPDALRDPHFMSQPRLVLSRLIRYDRIVRAENYAEDMAGVLRAIGVPEAEWPALGARENASGSEAVEVSPATEAMIRDAFAGDYEMIERA